MFRPVDIQNSADQAIHATAVESRHEREEIAFKLGLRRRDQIGLKQE